MRRRKLRLPIPRRAAKADPRRPRKRRFHLPVGRWASAAVRFAVRFVALFIVAASTFLATIYVSTSIFVDGSTISGLVVSVVERQTGGKLEIARSKFGLLSGFDLSEIRFYPPDPSNPVGYVNGGPVLSQPLATIASIRLVYDFSQIIFGRIALNGMQVVDPSLSVEERDGVATYAGILAYRASNFPSSPDLEPPPPPPEEESSGGLKIPAFIPVRPQDLYLPIAVAVQDVGIKNIAVSYRKSDASSKTGQEIEFRGFTVDLGGTWKGLASEFYIFLGSKPTETLVVKLIKQVGGDTETTEAAMNLSTRFSLVDLSKINFDIALDAERIATPLASFNDLQMHSELRSNVFEDLRGIHVDHLTFELAKSLNYKFQGDVSLPTGSPDLIRLDLDQSMELDLAALMTVAKPFVKDVDASGRVLLENLKIQGEVEPNKLADIATAKLPFVSLKLALEDLTANVHAANAELKPFNGTVSVAVTPALIGSGYQIDSMIDLQMDEFSTRQSSPFGPVSARIAEFRSSVIARAMYPAMLVPVAKVNVEIAHVAVNGGKLRPVDVPILMDVDADAAADLSKLLADFSLEVGNLLAVKADLDCRNRCEKFRVSNLLTLESLEAIHTLAYPVAAMVGAENVMPTKMTGSVDVKFDAKGTLPDPLKSPPALILKEGKVRFNTELVVNDLSVKVPLNNVNISEFETRFNLGGTLDTQKMNLRTGFKEVTIELPGATPAKPMAISLERFAYELAIKNEFLAALDLARPLENIKTSIGMNLHLAEVKIPDTLPQPLTGIGFEFQASQSKLQTVEISKLEARLPDFGVVAGMTLKTGLERDFFPNQLQTAFSLAIDHGGGKDILGLLRTQGQLGVSLDLATKDMKSLIVNGKTEFQHFSVAVNGKAPNDPKLLVIEDIDGKLPLKQALDISEMIAAIKTPPTDGKSSGVTVAADPDGTTKSLAETMAAFFQKTEDRVGKTANRAALVDYGTVRPFFPEKSPIKIKKVEAANLDLTEIEFDVEVRQNIFALNQFVINFLGGKIQGDFQFALDSAAKNPKDIPKTIRTSLHVTRLNTHKLLDKFPQLKGKEGSSILGSNPYIDATIHLQYDLATSDMDGGIEITSIGKEQLKMILYYVDPNEQNPTISDIRTALAIGDVRLVSIPIKNGEIGLEVDVRLLGAPLPVPKLSKVPVSQIVRNFTGGSKDLELGKDEEDEYEDFDNEINQPQI